MATVLAHEASHSLSHLLDRISMVSTVILRYDADSPSILDTRKRIKILCHFNGRRYLKSETMPVDTTVAIEIAIRELSLFAVSTPYIRCHTLLKS